MASKRKRKKEQNSPTKTPILVEEPLTSNECKTETVVVYSEGEGQQPHQRPRVFVITDPEDSPRWTQVQRECEREGLEIARVNAFMGNRWGIYTSIEYREDYSDVFYKIAPSSIGCTVSHWMLWGICSLFPDPYFVVLEDDVTLYPGFWKKTQEAISRLPEDWDMLYLGSCCYRDKIEESLGGGVYRITNPMCTHAYAVNSKTLRSLILEQQRAHMPIDIQLIKKSHSNKKIFTMAPRIAGQWSGFIS